MPDLDEATLARKTLTVTLQDREGKSESFTVGPMRMYVGGRLQQFLGKLDPPRATERAKALLNDSPGLAPEVQQQILAEARAEDRDWPPRLMFNPPLALATIMAADGGSEELLTQILADARRDLSESRCREFAGVVDLATLNEIVQVAMGGAAETPVRADSAGLVVLGPKGLESLVRAAVSAAAPGLADAEAAGIVAGLAGSADRFGTVINLSVERGAVEAPKGRAARSARSAS